MLTKLIPLALCALFANEAVACSCLRPDIARMHDDAEFVVLARLDGNSISIGKKKLAFSTIRAFKGEARERIVVWTQTSEAACGLGTVRGVPYVLFVYREDDKLIVDHCSSWPLMSAYSRYTTAFNEFYRLDGAEALDSRLDEQAAE